MRACWPWFISAKVSSLRRPTSFPSTNSARSFSVLHSRINHGTRIFLPATLQVSPSAQIRVLKVFAPRLRSLLREALGGCCEGGFGSGQVLLQLGVLGYLFQFLLQNGDLSLVLGNAFIGRRFLLRNVQCNGASERFAIDLYLLKPLDIILQHLQALVEALDLLRRRLGFRDAVLGALQEL